MAEPHPDELPTTAHIALGQYMAAWGNVESSLVWTITLVGGGNLNVNVLGSVSTTRNIIQALREIIEFGPVEVSADLGKVLDDFERLSKKRNKIVHGTWIHLFGVWKRVSIAAQNMLSVPRLYDGAPSAQSYKAINTFTEAQLNEQTKLVEALWARLLAASMPTSVSSETPSPGTSGN